MSGLTDWSTFGAAVAAGIAAGTALVTTRQNRRSMLEGASPRLHVQVLTGSSGRLLIAVENGGGGLAQSAGFAVLSQRDRLRASGHFGTGFLRSGERAMIRFEMPGRAADEPADDLYVVVTCRDTREFMHAWSNRAGHILVRSPILRWRPRYLGADDVFAKMFPEADPTGSRSCGWRVIDELVPPSPAEDSPVHLLEQPTWSLSGPALAAGAPGQQVAAGAAADRVSPITLGDMWDAVDAAGLHPSGVGMGSAYFNMRDGRLLRVPNRGFLDYGVASQELLDVFASWGIRPTASGKYPMPAEAAPSMRDPQPPLFVPDPRRDDDQRH